MYYLETWEGWEMYHTLNTSPYKAFRKTEAEHVQENYPAWVEQSANPEYERHLFDAYEAAMNSRH